MRRTKLMRNTRATLRAKEHMENTYERHAKHMRNTWEHMRNTRETHEKDMRNT